MRVEHMAVQSAAGPDLGGFVTAPRLFGKNKIRMHRAKEIHQWLQPQPRCACVCVTPSTMNKSLHADGGVLLIHTRGSLQRQKHLLSHMGGHTHRRARTHEGVTTIIVA